MQIASGRVVNGSIIVDTELPEGSEVTLLALDGEETFEVDAALASVLLASIEEGRQRLTIPADVLLHEMRGRE